MELVLPSTYRLLLTGHCKSAEAEIGPKFMRIRFKPWSTSYWWWWWNYIFLNYISSSSLPSATHTLLSFNGTDAEKPSGDLQLNHMCIDWTQSNILGMEWSESGRNHNNCRHLGRSFQGSEMVRAFRPPTVLFRRTITSTLTQYHWILQGIYFIIPSRNSSWTRIETTAVASVACYNYHTWSWTGCKLLHEPLNIDVIRRIPSNNSFDQLWIFQFRPVSSICIPV